MQIKGYTPGDADFDEKVARIEVWYDHGVKLWVVQRKNNDGDQIGAVDHYHLKSDARARLGELKEACLAEYGTIPEGWVYTKREG